MADKKYVPDGTFLICNKAAGFTALKVNPMARATLYGQKMANENDKISIVNIPPMGGCLVTKVVCTPVPTSWSPVKNNAKFNGGRLLQEDSEIPCAIGGKISITYIMPPGMAEFDENMSLADRLDAQLQRLGPAGAPLRFALGFGEGVVGGVVSMAEGLWSLGKMAVSLVKSIPDAIRDPAGAYDAAKAGVTRAAKGAWQAGVNAAKWVSNTDNIVALGHQIANASPRDIGKVTGRVAFEVAATYATAGAVNVARAGKLGGSGRNSCPCLSGC